MSISGMAASIRAATESETFDLGGQSVSSITHVMHDAFSEPFDIKNMIRITLVTGAGKLGRQKYDPDAAKAVTMTLRELGFDEDRGASCVVDCAGSFKLQHDTGKNLKTVVVFPKIQQQSKTLVEPPDLSGLAITGSIFNPETPEAIIAMSSQETFQGIVSTKCPSWSQKKGLLAVVESLKATLIELDRKLLSGQSLSNTEQMLYDSVSLDALQSKDSFVRKQMQVHVETGNLTKFELETLLSQVTERVNNLEQQLAESQEKPKVKEKLKEMKERAEERKALLSKIQPKLPHRLRHDAEIQKLLTEMAPLTKIDEESKGRLLSVKETQMVGRRREILEQIAELEQSSREWFEEENAFAARVALTHQSFAAKEKSAKKATSKSASLRLNTGLKTAPRFVTPAGKNGVSNAWGAKGATPKSKKSPGGVFAAMMDSDSD